MGSAIECFDDADAVVVPRSRFAPVKTCNDLFALRSGGCLGAGSDLGHLPCCAVRCSKCSSVTVQHPPGPLFAARGRGSAAASQGSVPATHLLLPLRLQPATEVPAARFGCCALQTRTA